PQLTVNVRVKDKAAAIGDSAVKAKLKEVETLIAGKGRALLRESGTEPVIRIMIEAETHSLCEQYAKMLSDTIIERGFCVE
ncbi:MAG: phosphoglucosamine mutase, partial [Oscillospiraceae bacterium]|nr:phosphoglucosamine mutase [Oscillospiraceae bacterium]